MAETVKSILDEEMSHWDGESKSLAQALVRYERHFVNKREENIEFLGGVLLGRPRFRFFDGDRDEFFDDTLELDDVLLRRRIHSLPDVDPSHKVSADVFNITCFYLAHRLRVSDIDKELSYKGQVSVLRVLHYRYLSSMMAHYFKYEPDKRVAEAVYSQLNNRFSLKRAGSWYNLITQRCEDVLSSSSIHADTLDRFEPYASESGRSQRGSIKYLINDTQSRIKDVINKLTELFYEVRKSERRVISRDVYIQLEERQQIRDLIRSESQLRRSALTVLRDPDSFVRESLLEVITQLMPNTPRERLTKVLRYLSENIGHRGDKDIELFVDELITHAIEYLDENRKKFGGSLSYTALLQRLRSVYMSSRSQNRLLLSIRDRGNKLVARSLGTNNKNIVSSVRTATSLYVVLRTLAYQQYNESIS